MRRFLILAMIAAVLVVIPAGAQATQPLDVDCGLLQDANDAVDDLLDSFGDEFRLKNFGANASLKDADGALAFFSAVAAGVGLVIEFEDISQLTSTNAKCGLTKFVIDNIRD